VTSARPLENESPRKGAFVVPEASVTADAPGTLLEAPNVRAWLL
jgi:hypothetical protein